MSNTIKILIAVVVLAAAGAGGWFFFFEEDAPPSSAAKKPPATKTVVKKAAGDAVKPAEPDKTAAAPAAAPAVQPAAASATAPAAQPASAPAPAAQPAAGQPAAQASPAKPIPSNPDRLVAEVVESSGLPAAWQSAGEEFTRRAVAGEGRTLSPEETRIVAESVKKAFDPALAGAEVRTSLKAGADPERLARFLEILRQPAALKMAEQERAAAQPDAWKDFSAFTGKSPPSAERVKLIRSLDDITRSSEVESEIAGAMVREMLDAALAQMRKPGSKMPKETSQQVATQLNSVRAQARAQAVNMLAYTYRNASDEDLSAYVKLLDTDTGRWGSEQLANAVRPAYANRFGAVGKEIAQLAVATRTAESAKAPPPAAAEPLATAKSETQAEKAASGPSAAPAEPVGYRRPASIRDLYSRYNDLVTATVMGDGASVKELLEDGKNPNDRQSDGVTPLMIAANKNDVAIASMLLAKGADPNLRAAGGMNALKIAKARGPAGAPMVQLLQRSGARD